jgi:hypothetical protein
MPKKLDDDIARIHMVVPAAWAKKVDDWRRREPDLPMFRRPSELVEMGAGCQEFAALRPLGSSSR